MVVYQKPTLHDIPQMQELVLDEVKRGIILFRSNDEVATNIRSYTIAKQGEKIIGFLALHIHTLGLAEIRSMVMSPEYRGKGIGKELIKVALKEAQSLGIQKTLVLAYQKTIFEALGFVEIPKESLPEHKIWADCIKCQHFPVCNEFALIKEL